jgi:ribosomal protein S25
MEGEVNAYVDDVKKKAYVDVYRLGQKKNISVSHTLIYSLNYLNKISFFFTKTKIVSSFF